MDLQQLINRDRQSGRARAGVYDYVNAGLEVVIRPAGSGIVPKIDVADYGDIQNGKVG